ncbi:histone [Corynebacterium parakroppenstedtii]|uniref:histone n=1 Tax=Corynebacterium parakroppenstedtii TaxID=2828363 RepID=UPI001EF01131|nr:histone [Corynebacterium parakroppenstedtii]MCF6792246.1 histone [Corynebacterium parakroppenstedtii]
MPPKVTDKRATNAESLHAVEEETAIAAQRIVATYAEDFFDYTTLTSMLGVEPKGLIYRRVAKELGEPEIPGKKPEKKAAKKSSKKSAGKKSTGKGTKKSTKKSTKKTTKKSTGSAAKKSTRKSTAKKSTAKKSTAKKSS